jgi:hypothetical protein
MKPLITGLAVPTLLLVVGGAMIGHPSADSQQSKSKTSRYLNARYQFSVSYPTGWSVKESDNGDGATIASPDGTILIRAYAENDVGLYSSLAELADATRSPMQKACKEPLAVLQTPASIKPNSAMFIVGWRCPAAMRDAYGAFSRSGQSLYSLLMEAPVGQSKETSRFQELLSTWHVPSR